MSPFHESENRGRAEARGGPALQEPERHPWDVENPLHIHTEEPSHIGPNRGDDGKHSRGHRWHLSRSPTGLLHQDGDSTRDGTGLAVRNRRQGHRRHGHRRGHRHGRLHHFGNSTTACARAATKTLVAVVLLTANGHGKRQHERGLMPPLVAQRGPQRVETGLHMTTHRDASFNCAKEVVNELPATGISPRCSRFCDTHIHGHCGLHIGSHIPERFP